MNRFPEKSIERNHVQIAVIGGGAAGCLAAIAAARTGCSVLIIEKNDRLARKIYATGNGRCNLTNLFLNASCYHCGGDDRDIPRVLSAIDRFSNKDLIHFFKSLGVPVHDRDGYVYPRTDQAETVAKALEKKIRELKIQVLLEHDAQQILYRETGLEGNEREESKREGNKRERSKREGNVREENGRSGSEKGWNETEARARKNVKGCFEILTSSVGTEGSVRDKDTKKNSVKKADHNRNSAANKTGIEKESPRSAEIVRRIIRCREVILCTGGLAGPAFGCGGGGYRLAGSFSHRIATPLPALTPLLCDCPYLKRADGVRCHAMLTLTDSSGTPLPGASEEGELQLTAYGLSGIPAMQLGSIAARRLESGPAVFVRIDFLPEFSHKLFQEEVRARLMQDRGQTLGDLCLGLVHKKILDLLFASFGLQAEMKARRFSDPELTKMLTVLRHFSMKVTGVRSFDHAQVTSGGIPMREVDEGFQSLLQPGLFLAGELLDVDGKCGGYNLQWAMSSGYLAGKAAAEALHGSTYISL